MWREIVCFNRLASRLFVRTNSFEINLNNFRVAVAPLTFDKIDALLSCEINFRVRRTGGCIRIGIGKRATSQKHQDDEHQHGGKPESPERCFETRVAMPAVKFRRPSSDKRGVDREWSHGSLGRFLLRERRPVRVRLSQIAFDVLVPQVPGLLVVLENEAVVEDLEFIHLDRRELVD